MSDTRHKTKTVSQKKRKTAKTRFHPLNKSIVFVDNTRELWDNDMVRLSSSVDYVHVPCNNTDEKSDKEWLYAKSLAKQGNLYAKAIVSKHKFRTYPPNHGINPKIVERLKKWARNTDGPLVALFDWDRTISCVEGISVEVFNDYIGHTMMDSQNEWTSYPSKEFLDDMFVYLMRSSRIPMIKDLFRELRTRGVDVRIVTNNLAASRRSLFRRIFLEMLARIFNEDVHEKKEYDFERNGAIVHIYEEYSTKSQVISAAELDAMLHSTVDYIREDERLNQRCLRLNQRCLRLNQRCLRLNQRCPRLNKSIAVCRMNPPIHAVREICGGETEPSMPILYILNRPSGM